MGDVPQRAVAVTLHVHMRRRGAPETLQGYRGQHHIVWGDQRRTRFAPSLSMGEKAAMGCDELETARLSCLRWSEGRRSRFDPGNYAHRTQAVSRRYMQEMIPFVGPIRHHGTENMGTNDRSWRGQDT